MNNNNNQEAIRMSLFQFLGGLTKVCPDNESIVATISEELVRISRIDPALDDSDLHTDMIRPILKSTLYILKIRYNKLKSDTITAFGESNNWPIPVKDSLDNQIKLIDMLEDYIKQL